MPDENHIATSIACPRCDKSPLSKKNGGYRCGACKVDYPSVGGIPWLFAEPDASLGEWRNRLHFSLQQLANESQRIQAELAADDVPSLTRKRLERQVKAVDEHRKLLRNILEPVDIRSLQAKYESYLALRTRLPIDQGIQTYYSNIHRDWCWGDTENEASVSEIKKIISEGDGDSDALGDTLMLGAGACRLAYDIHMQLETTRDCRDGFQPLVASGRQERHARR